MSIGQKMSEFYNSIDFSKLRESPLGKKLADQLEDIANDSENFTNQVVLEEEQSNFDRLKALIEKKIPSAIKEPAADPVDPPASPTQDPDPDPAPTPSQEPEGGGMVLPENLPEDEFREFLNNTLFPHGTSYGYAQEDATRVAVRTVFLRHQDRLPDGAAKFVHEVLYKDFEKLENALRQGRLPTELVTDFIVEDYLSRIRYLQEPLPDLKGYASHYLEAHDIESRAGGSKHYPTAGSQVSYRKEEDLAEKITEAGIDASGRLADRLASAFMGGNDKQVTPNTSLATKSAVNLQQRLNELAGEEAIKGTTMFTLVENLYFPMRIIQGLAVIGAAGSAAYLLNREEKSAGSKTKKGEPEEEERSKKLAKQIASELKKNLPTTMNQVDPYGYGSPLIVKTFKFSRNEYAVEVKPDGRVLNGAMPENLINEMYSQPVLQSLMDQSGDVEYNGFQVDATEKNLEDIRELFKEVTFIPSKKKQEPEKGGSSKGGSSKDSSSKGGSSKGGSSKDSSSKSTSSKTKTKPKKGEGDEKKKGDPVPNPPTPAKGKGKQNPDTPKQGKKKAGGDQVKLKPAFQGTRVFNMDTEINLIQKFASMMPAKFDGSKRKSASQIATVKKAYDRAIATNMIDQEAENKKLIKQIHKKLVDLYNQFLTFDTEVGELQWSTKQFYNNVKEVADSYAVFPTVRLVLRVIGWQDKVPTEEAKRKFVKTAQNTKKIEDFKEMPYSGAMDKIIKMVENTDEGERLDLINLQKLIKDYGLNGYVEHLGYDVDETVHDHKKK